MYVCTFWDCDITLIIFPSFEIAFKNTRTNETDVFTLMGREKRKTPDNFFKAVGYRTFSLVTRMPTWGYPSAESNPIFADATIELNSGKNFESFKWLFVSSISDSDLKLPVGNF